MKIHDKIRVIDQFKAQEIKVRSLVDIIIKASELATKASGYLLYAAGFKGNMAIIQKVWETKKDNDSLKMVGLRGLIGEAMILREGDPVKRQELEVLGRHGLTL